MDDKGMHMHRYVDTAMCAELIGRGRKHTNERK